MITIQQIVDIPASRRISFDLPKTVPSGRASVVLVFDAPDVPYGKIATLPGQDIPRQFPTIEELKAEAARKTTERLADPSRDSLARYAGCLADSRIFEGDTVAIQREMRDEWD
jgi:hypothetical protein